MATKIRPESIVYPDTAVGAKLALTSCCSKAFLRKVERLEKKDDWEWYPGDLPGSWLFGRWEGATPERPVNGRKAYLAVYMAGYNDQQTSDFEEMLP